MRDEADGGLAMERLKHVVVVIPGIGGSVLQPPEGAAHWDEHRRRLIAAATRPGRLSLDARPDLTPVDLLSDIRLIGPFVLPGYDGLVRQIRRSFADVRVDVSRPDRTPDPRADLVLFPYDFRKGIVPAAHRLAADMDARLRGLSPAARRRRVIIVAHSMGGLVARYWLGPLGGAADCAALLTLGTPHRGAPKALDYLVNGVRVSRKQFAGLTRVLRGWPSMYDLLPRYPAVQRADDGATLYPHELDGGLLAVAEAKAAYQRHVDIETAWQDLSPEDRPEVIPAYARGHATPSRAVLSLREERHVLSVTKDAPLWLPNPEWHGDGSVPAISAVPLELDEKRGTWRGQPERHLALASCAAVVDVLTAYAGASLSSVRGEEPDRPWLGLDLDESVLAGEPVRVGITLRGAQAEAETQVHVRAVAAQGRPQRVTPWVRGISLDSSGGSWVAEIAEPLDAGLYTVEVTATGVPGVGRLRTTDELGVVNVLAEAGTEEGRN
ncbi:hypothetical protein [Streptomyces afghaniensis 772] [Streptomyces afghaniensis]